MSAAIANTYRFFVPPESLQGNTFELTDAELAHQIGRVLRLRPGSRVLLLDGVGNACTVVLTDTTTERLRGDIVARTPAGGEPASRLTLYVPLIRAERFEWILQKGTETGAAAFVPVLWSRAVATEQRTERKLPRWQRIVREAAEQACRGWLPTVTPPITVEEACAEAATSDMALLLWEGPSYPAVTGQLHPTPSLRAILRPAAATPPRSIAVLSGPEGGITPAELTSAVHRGIIPVSLGPRILRAETAPVVASAALFYELEDIPDTA
ncbi:MAG: 16S rRNA (uracil(1498)-N(3))-methyltransferase [Chloroflexaceae bacterium]|nr:16S rRNA (uracil(1498)-N(3))-methyltransferase [Chloroflexaceae bacterium]